MEPGYDVVVQAAAGIIAATGYPGQPPCKPGPSMADMASGLQMTQGILLAIIERERSGLGQEVLVKMQDAAMFMMAQYSTPLIDNPDYEFKPNGMAHIEATPSNGFKTSDGYIFTAPAGEKLMAFLEQPENRPGTPSIPVTSNVTGAFYMPEDNITELLARQVSGSVMLEQDLKALLEAGYRDYLEIGPGNTMQGFLKKTARAMHIDVNCAGISTAEDLKTVIA